MEEWEDKIGILEEIVFARLLLKGAEQNSINIKAISEDPFSIYVECKANHFSYVCSFTIWVETLHRRYNLRFLSI